MDSAHAGPSHTPRTAKHTFNGASSSPSPITAPLPSLHIDVKLYQTAKELAPIQPVIPLGPICHHYALGYEREADVFLRAILQEQKSGSSSGKGKAVAIDSATDSAHGYIRFLYLALALLRKAAAQAGGSIREHAYISYDFGRIGLKLLRAGAGGEGDELTQEVSSILSRALQSVKKSMALAGLRRDLSLLNAEVMLVQGDEKRAVKFLKTSRGSPTDQDDSAYLYKINLMLAQIHTTSSTPNTLAALEELQDMMSQAETRGDVRLVQLGALARLRLIFANNLWSEVEACITACATAIGYTDPPSMLPPIHADLSSSRGTSATASPAPTATDTGSLEDIKPAVAKSAAARLDAWDLSMRVHFLCMRAVWESRIGAAKRSKAVLEAIFSVGDGLCEIKETSGVHEIAVHPSAPDRHGGSLLVQLTPPSVLETMIYYAACISRRDTIGAKEHCKRLRCAQLGMERLSGGKASAWDMTPGGYHDLALIESMAANLQDLKASLLLEVATTSLLRNAHEDTVETINVLIQHLRKHNLFTAYSSRVFLLQAQLAQSLNMGPRARQCYRACYGTANAGSDLDLVARLNEMCMLIGNRRGSASLALETALTALVEQCHTSNEAGIRIASMLLAALMSDGVQQTKKGMSRVLTVCNQAELQVARQIAFTISAPLYAHTQPLQSIKLLESALTLSQLHGGREREDGVGHAALGSLVGRELGILYARTGRSKEKVSMMQTIVKSCRRRFEELVAAGPGLVGVAEEDGRETKRRRLTGGSVEGEPTPKQSAERELKRERETEDGRESGDIKRLKQRSLPAASDL